MKRKTTEGTIKVNCEPFLPLTWWSLVEFDVDELPVTVLTASFDVLSTLVSGETGLDVKN